MVIDKIKNLINYLSFNNIVDGIFANLLWWVLVFFIGLLWDGIYTKKLTPLIYKWFPDYKKLKYIVNIINKIIKLLLSPYLRIFIIGLLLISINLHDINTLLYSFIIFIFSATILWKPKKEIFFNPISEFSDGFESENLSFNKWDMKTGNLEIDKNFGKPAPDLELKLTPERTTNTFLWVKDINKRTGIIECDFYLEPNGILNIVFFGNSNNDKWYMARYDARKEVSDGIIIKDQGPGNNWRHHIMSGTHTEPKKWFRARVELKENMVKMYKDNELIAQLENPIIFGEKIGIFNEVNNVHIDNFSIFNE